MAASAAAAATAAATHHLAGRRALIVGGTSGIGAALARHLAARGAHVTVAGRNRAAGEAVARECDAARAAASGSGSGSADSGSADSTADACGFDAVDCTSLQSVRDLARRWVEASSSEGEDEQKLQQQQRLDYLVLTPGYGSLGGRDESEDGLDKKLQVNIYSRVALICALMPLLEKTAALPGADVRVMTMLSAGVHSAYTKFRDDPDLSKHYSLNNAANHAGTYNDLAVDKLAQLHPDVTFIHTAPGFVATDWGNEHIKGFTGWGMNLMKRLAAKSPDACATALGPSMYEDKYKGGYKLVGPGGNIIEKRISVHNDDNRDFVWDHLINAVGLDTKEEGAGAGAAAAGAAAAASAESGSEEEA